MNCNRAYFKEKLPLSAQEENNRLEFCCTSLMDIPGSLIDSPDYSSGARIRLSRVQVHSHPHPPLSSVSFCLSLSTISWDLAVQKSKAALAAFFAAMADISTADTAHSAEFR